VPPSSPQQPPLPPGPPPPTQPLPPPQAPFFESHPLPPVAALLLREAEAWRALVQLHQGVVGATRAVAQSLDDPDVQLETTREAVEAREQGYYAALTQLASNCDQLSDHALRLRSLRKARATADVTSLQALMRPHIVETLAIGATLASNAALSVNAVTSELRQAAITTRAQIEQVQEVLRVLQAAPNLANGGNFYVGKLHNGHLKSFECERVFEAVKHQGETLNANSLCAAIAQLCSREDTEESPAAECVAEGVHRTLVRRPSDQNR